VRRGTFVRDIIARESLRDKPTGGPTFSFQILVRRRALVFVGLKCPGMPTLPAPKKLFYMLMRMYPPDIEVLSGRYEIPGVVKGK
jgi:hypothetical protein